MRPFTSCSMLVLILNAVAGAEEPPRAGWPATLPITAGPPASPPVATGLPERYEPEPIPVPQELPGQQHWVALNFSILQPMVGRVQVKVWPRPNNSLWLEAYGGSELFALMYGFGARVMHTRKVGGRGDVLMVSPGLGIHVLPQWHVSERGESSNFPGLGYGDYHNSLYYAALDVDVSWLHEFSDHFGYEIGVKLGLAGRVGGRVGNSYPHWVMIGRDFYPLFNVYSGLRF